MSCSVSALLRTVFSTLCASPPAALGARFFHVFDPETAHHIALRTLGMKFWKYLPPPKTDKRLEIHLMGRVFSSPIGMAAGFDKNAEAVWALRALGLGFAEIGTVTPRAQPGNPKPRLWRLRKARAIINRMGFNSPGAACFKENLLKNGLPEDFPLGINLGINKTGATPLTDYPELLEEFSPFATYIAINLSSPNTPGLRDLQNTEFLEQLLSALKAANTENRPVFIKLSPDLEDKAFAPLIETCVNYGVTGLILTNTTKSRDFDLASPFAQEEGGLSGAPLQKRALEVLKIAAPLAKNRLLLISSGGISTGADILTRLKLGADLVQIYSAFIYEGAPLLFRLKKELLAAMAAEGIETLSDLRTASHTVSKK